MEKRILFVDREVITDAYRLVVKVSKIPWDILPFSSSMRAMGAIEDGLDYDLAIIDRTLGEREIFNAGDAVIELSKRKNPQIYVISFSAYNDKAPHSDYHICKNDNSDEVVRAITRGLESCSRTI